MSASPAAPGAVAMTAESDGSIQMTLTHGPSGTTLHTDAPRDNGGEGRSFSPTDLFAASLASCAVTTMALAAKRENLPWGPVRVALEKRMAGPPRRVGEIVLDVHMPSQLPAAQRAHLEEVAHGCPVQRSLHPDVKVTLRFHYAG